MSGRPTKRSPERVQAILMALRIGNTRRASAAAAEISEDTLARWMGRDAAFCGAVEKAEADAELRFLGQVAQAARGTWQAAAWWLERRRHENSSWASLRDVPTRVLLSLPWAILSRPSQRPPEGDWRRRGPTSSGDSASEAPTR